jgi:hypothetical protein
MIRIVLISHLPYPVNTREQNAASPSTIDQARADAPMATTRNSLMRLLMRSWRLLSCKDNV